MRTRVIRPDFWQDDTLGHLPDPVRLFYIGLWGVADDAGWLEWRPAQIGAVLYPYKPSGKRQREVTQWGGVLATAGRLVLHECGCGFIPTFAKHQRAGGNPSYQYREKHRHHVARKAESGQVHTGIAIDEVRVDEVRVGEVRVGAGPGAGPGRADWEQKIVEMRRHGQRESEVAR